MLAESLWQQTTELLELIFGADVPAQPLGFGQLAARTILVYVMGVFVVRLGKSRLISRVTSVDVLVGFILGSLLSRAITGHASLIGTFESSVGLVAAHWLFTWIACHSHTFGTLIKGHENLLVKDGEILHDRLRQSHISTHDLEAALRLQGVESLSEVKRAYKERNGEISVIRATSSDQCDAGTHSGSRSRSNRTNV